MLKVPTQSFSSPHVRESGIQQIFASTMVWNPLRFGIRNPYRNLDLSYASLLFHSVLPVITKSVKSVTKQSLCGWFLSCYSLSSENSSLSSCGRIQTYLRLSSVKRENAPKECETREKPLFSQSQPKCQHAWFTVKTKLTLRKSVFELFSHRQLVRRTVNSLLTDLKLETRGVDPCRTAII